MKVYVDMDGVLVNWKKGATKLVNCSFSNPNVWGDKTARRIKKIRDEFGSSRITSDDLELRQPNIRSLVYTLITKDRLFWADLEWLGSKNDLWSPLVEICNDYDVELHILTSPILSDTKCEPQKRQWCEVNLGKSGSFVHVEQDKWKYATEGGEPNILIDDTDKKLDSWEENGGIPIKYTGNPYLALVSVEEKLEQIKGNQ